MEEDDTETPSVEDDDADTCAAVLLDDHDASAVDELDSSANATPRICVRRDG